MKISVLRLLFFVLPLTSLAAPFAEWFSGTSPKGVRVRVWGQGDEYSIHYETEDGHAVVKDPATRTYFYARQDADGALVSTGIAVGDETDADRAVLAAIPLHEADTSVAAREARQKRIDRDESETSRRARWAKQKEAMRKLREAKEKGLLMAPPSRPTLGSVRGLVVLIDFPIEGSGKTTWSSVHSDVTKEQLDELLNGENCKLYGNYSSVHSYYHDVSNGRLDYSMAVIGPITAPQPREHYDDPTRDNGACARELMGDVFKIIWADPDFSTKYLPLLRSLTTADGYVRSLNFWFAGESAEEWSYGLWAHKWSVGSTFASTYSFTVDGKTIKFGSYQITPITSKPGIYTFCHENGHMLCDFPDLYNYTESISGNRGVGYFSLMFGSADAANPPYFDAYLRAAAGWVEPQLLPSAGGTVTVRNNHTDVWKYENPNDPSEYYLIENRQRSGRDASIKGSGILIWRCYEWGDNCYPDPASYLSGFASGVYRWNYELSLEQADGDYDIERGSGSGDAYDTWYKGNSYYKSTGGQKGVFSDGSLPTAKWVDASDSGLKLSNFSANGDTMTFDVAAYTPASQGVSLTTALDNDRLAFVTGGDERWYGQATTATTGGSAAKSGAIDNSASSWFKAVVKEPGELSFDWMVSSEKNYDFLEFSIDGVVQEKISGTVSWATKTYRIGEGEHVLLWTYHKDSSTKSGDDAGYVDHVVWTPDSESVAKPVISGPKTELFASPAEVILTFATAGAEIRYTLDGSDPTESSALYERPIVITGDVTVKARAFAKDLKPSAIAAATYRLKAELGAWTDDVERARASAAIDGNLILFMRADCTASMWTDGAEPSCASASFLAWAAENGIYLVLWDDSDVTASGALAAWWKDLGNKHWVSDDVTVPQFYLVSPTDDLTPLTEAAYVLNDYSIGSVKFNKTSASLVGGIISLLGGTGIGLTPFGTADPEQVLRTSGMDWSNDSDVAWREEYPNQMRAGGMGAKYASRLTAAVKGRGRLTFSYKACSYSGSNEFTFSLNGSRKLRKYYTSAAGTDFSGTETYEITNDDGATFQWAYTVGSTNSVKSHYDYSYCGVWLYDVAWTPMPVATPVVEDSPVVLIDGYRDVAVTCPTEGATIFYTLDGTDPTEGSRYLSGGAIRLTDDATLKVRAYKEGMGPSEVVTVRYLLKANPGEWTTDAERARLSAAADGQMICVAKLSESLAAWSTLGPILTGERFLSWAAANGIYLVKWDSAADSSGTSASAEWFQALYAQRGTGSMYNWEMCFARSSAPDALCGYARAYKNGSTAYSVGSVKYDETVPGVIAGFASILHDNGLTPTPIIAASEIGPFLQTSNFEWHNDSPLSWRDEQSGPTNLLHVGGFVGTAYTATLSATVADQGTLMFDYKVVSTNAANTFVLKVNGNPAIDARSAGTFSGTETVKVLLNGPATIEWIYTVGSAKDEKSTSGVWISNVKWVSAKTPSGRVRPYVRATWKNGKTTYERIEE